jgi:hypothetical protein
MFVRQVLPFGYEGPAKVAESLTSWSDVIRHCEIVAQVLSILTMVVNFLTLAPQFAP